MKASLGVLITYFNERDLLRECLDSLLAQRERPDEILIYDDASNYPADEYIPDGFPIQIIHGDVNRGPSYGRHVLLHASQSDYIHFHDADDLFHPDWCQRVCQVIEEIGTDAVFTEISSYREGQIGCERVLGLNRLVVGEDLVRFCLRGAMLVPAGTYRKSAIKDVGGYRRELWQSEDFDFHVRLAASGIRYRVIVDPLVFIRIRPSGRSQNQLEVWTSAVEAIHKLSKELPLRYHHDLAEKAIQAGSVLFQLGAHSDARKAFQFARELGPPTFSQQRRFYSYVARAFGPELAERVRIFYRTVIPKTLRNVLADRGW